MKLKKCSDVKMYTANGRCTMTCNRCGEECIFALPNNPEFVVKIIKAFDVLHRVCASSIPTEPRA